MKKLLKSLRKNNKGSSLVVAIVAAGFVGILATVIVSSAMTNYQLNVMDNNSKKTFYSAESVLDEIYAGVGMDCYNSLADSYTYTVSNLLTQTTVNGTVVYIQRNNSEANQMMQDQYIETMSSRVTDIDTAKAYLNSFITYTDHADVKSIGMITPSTDVNGNVNKLTLEDMTVEYKTNKSEDYFSTVTVDVVIAYPEMSLDFTNNIANGLETYLKYCLIGMDSINIGKDGTSVASPSIIGGAFAGDNGLNIYSGSELDVTADAAGLPSTLVVSGDINLLGGNSNSVLNVGNASIWTDNINVGDTNGPGLINFSSDLAKTYVADDLTLKGAESKVTLAGSFYGFGNQGYESDSSKSSAIIVNGRKCTIDMSAVNYLLLAGRAYIDFGMDASTQYMTADSIAVKGNQEIYMVPAAYVTLADGTAATNPSKSLIVAKLDKFFAYRLGYLDTVEPYVIKNVNGYYYAYLNFKNKTAQADYVKCVMSESFLKSALGNKYSAADTTDRDNLMKIINRSLNRFVTTESMIKLNESASVFTSGTLMQVSQTGEDQVMDVYNNTLVDYAAVKENCSSKYNRYSILKSFLYDAGDGTETGLFEFPESIKIDGNSYLLDGADQLPTIYSQSIDTTALKNLGDNIEHINEDALGTIAAVIVKGNDSTTLYNVPAAATSGVILAYGVDVQIDHDFEGLIMTDRKIYVMNNARISTGTDSKAGQALDKYPDVSKYFYSFKNGSEDASFGQTDISDMLEFNNWRKNE